MNVIWFDENYDRGENIGYLNELKTYQNLKIKCFKKIEIGIKYIKEIKFEVTNIILSGRLYIEFIKKFRDEIKDIYIIPKIIIFTKDKNEFLKHNNEYKNYIDNSFYNLGGIKTVFKDIKDFILKPLNKKIMNRDNDAHLTFEYIDCKEKLYYPMLYKALIDTTRLDNIDIFTNKIYNQYKKNSSKINNLLKSIENIQNIPVELLSKYYARIYTAESENGNNFYSDINKDLRENKKDNYLSYIKILYEGIKIKTLPLGSNNILYRGTSLSNEEINKIKNYINNKIKGLPGAILFSKTFLSFTKDIKIAKNFLMNQNNNNEFNKVLFILEKDSHIDYNLSTHADIEKLSFYPKEKEVLFFPFSSFEIKEINKINMLGENIYKIRLLYLGKYMKELENYDNINIIPNSEFKQQIIESGLIKQQVDDTPKNILKKNNEYKNEINNNNE